MNVNLLAISVGNTRTQIGAFNDGKIEQFDSVDNDQPDACSEAIVRAMKRIDTSESHVLLASVNSNAEQTVTDIAEQITGKPVVRMERDMPIAIGRQLDRESIIGDDRLLNAAGAYDVLKQACVIIDAGTAMTVDFVDGAGTFHGGAILPGAKMMLNALHSHTDQLPEISLVSPDETIGHNTADAMRTGIFHGLRGAARELVEQFAEVVGAYPMVIVTGGDAELLFNDYDLVDRVVPELTLLGMAVSLHAIENAES